MRLHLLGAFAEGGKQRRGKPADLERRLLTDVDLIAQATNADRQLLAVDFADRFLELIERPRVQAAPAVLSVAGHIQNDGVGVELRVLGAAGVMAEGRRGDVAGANVRHMLAFTNARAASVTFGERQRRSYGLGVSLMQPAIAGDERHDRYRLGRAERQVPAGAMLAAALAMGAQRLPGR